ncbi:hypothetical protein HPP92_009685 [Vanilla planifolia]|uniref:Growth-regulating factor n=1 Tax=Vanilla planifolia TaxID=51239 RepID=A0A835V772_VANPL|nr:hypothetical protein HPP92_009685 [Vanilla planifolia]
MSCHHLFTRISAAGARGAGPHVQLLLLGLPVPSHLLVSFGRSTRKRDSEGFFPRHPPLGWGCFKLGSRGKAQDLEPGRCRRTDGKKWRCSRGACPGSKYCVRHLHRGKNRLRKTTEPPLLLLPPETRDFEEHRYSNPVEERETEQPSSSGTSGLSFQNETKLSFNSRAMEEEQKKQKAGRVRERKVSPLLL